VLRINVTCDFNSIGNQMLIDVIDPGQEGPLLGGNVWACPAFAAAAMRSLATCNCCCVCVVNL